MKKEKENILPEDLLYLAADSSKMPGFTDSLSALLEVETKKYQSEELDEDTLELAAGGKSDFTETPNEKPLRKR